MLVLEFQVSKWAVKIKEKKKAKEIEYSDSTILSVEVAVAASVRDMSF